jgi:hypothetical protein
VIIIQNWRFQLNINKKTLFQKGRKTLYELYKDHDLNCKKKPTKTVWIGGTAVRLVEAKTVGLARKQRNAIHIITWKGQMPRGFW